MTKFKGVKWGCGDSDRDVSTIAVFDCGDATKPPSLVARLAVNPDDGLLVVNNHNLIIAAPCLFNSLHAIFEYFGADQFFYDYSDAPNGMRGLIRDAREALNSASR